MTASEKVALVRNVLVSGTNGAITLVILLIAPLGLAAVLINTALVMVATFTTAQTADQVIRFLQGDRRETETVPEGTRVQVLSDEAESGPIQHRS